ncbi:MAG: cytochrome b [Xanthobacteraceae bacterium]|nr:cytochrome b [Xanthobacteraceae bacterium]
MTYGTRKGGYPASSKWLHWAVAACVLITIPVALTMKQISEGPLQDTLYNLHKSLGVLILLLMILRLINRLMVGAPVPDPAIARWQKAVSSAVHGLLYVLLFLMSATGYVANSAYGAKTPFFGLFELPMIIAKNEPLSEKLFAFHKYTGWLVAVLVVMHIGAALQHHVIHRDNVLRRMLPRAIGGI